MAPGSSLRYEDTFSLLLGRDRCSDAFGSTASDETCSPSRTLCCVRQGQEYPSCQQALGKGWCCVGNKPTDNCYIDQPSVCEEQNSVPCTNLGEGIEKACCPRLTSCAPGTAARNDIVRCNIQYSDLERAAGWSLSSSSAQTTTSSTSSTSSSTTTSSTSSTELSTPAATSDALTAATSEALQTPPPSGASSQNQGTSELSAGLIAGAAVGGTLGFVALLVLGYLILRRLLKMTRRQQTGSRHSYPPPPGASQPAYGHRDYHSQTTTAVGPVGYGYPPQSTEPMGVMANWKSVYDHQPKEPVELPAAWGRPKPTELY